MKFSDIDKDGSPRVAVVAIIPRTNTNWSSPAPLYQKFLAYTDTGGCIPISLSEPLTLIGLAEKHNFVFMPKDGMIIDPHAPFKFSSPPTEMRNGSLAVVYATCFSVGGGPCIPVKTSEDEFRREIELARRLKEGRPADEDWTGFGDRFATPDP